MNAIDLIIERMDVERLLEHYQFDKLKTNSRMYRSCCKLHEGDNPNGFVIDSETGLYYCHTGGCGGGDIFTLVEKMENITFTEAVRWLADFYGIDLTNVQITERKAKHVKDMKAWIEAIKSRRKTEKVAFHIEEPIKDVKKFRNFKESTLKRFNVGYVDSVKLEKKNRTNDGENSYYTLKKRLVIPIIQDGKQVGMSFRRIVNTDIPKWSHQPANIVTGDLLYNFDEAKGEFEIVLVEGSFDVWAFHEIGVVSVATYGAHLTDEQYKLLMRTGADITLAFDGDEAGRTITNKVLEMFKNKATLRYIHFEEGEDPASIPREELKKRYDERVKRL